MQPDEFQKTFDVSRETFLKLEIYHALLLKWQKAINLVSPASLKNAWFRHFADSAQLSGLISDDIKIVADLGSGAGFPGMVLAILRPDLKFHLIESDERKCQFLKNVARETGTDIIIHNSRVEERLYEVAPDLITARAFAPLKEIIEFTEPLMNGNVHFSMLLLKGREAEKEVADAEKYYNFDIQYLSSATDPAAKILDIANLAIKK